MVDNRALGDLIPSRSLGDFKTKDKCPGAVIAQPDVRTFELKEGDKWLLLASDGLWDDLKVGRRRTGPRGLGGDSTLLSPSSLPCPVASLASPLPSPPTPLPSSPSPLPSPFPSSPSSRYRLPEPGTGCPALCCIHSNPCPASGDGGCGGGLGRPDEGGERIPANAA